MAKISSINEVTFSKNKKQVFKQNSASSNVIRSVENFSNYSADNLKANFLNAKSAVSFTGAEVKEEFDVNQFIANFSVQNAQKKFDQSAISHITNTPPERRIKGNFYSKTADDLAVMIGPDKHAIFLHEPGVDPAIFIHKFTDNIDKGNYRGLGINQGSTDVISINNINGAEHNSALQKVVRVRIMLMKEAFDALNEEKIEINPESLEKKFSEILDAKSLVDPSISTQYGSISEVLGQLSDETPAHRIVFIKDYQDLISRMNKAGVSDLNQHLTKYFPNLSIVGFMEKSKFEKLDYVQVMLDKSLGKQIHDISAVKSIPTMPIEGLNTEESKEFLKKNPSFINQVLGKYQEATGLTISYSAIDQLVDEAAIKVDEPLPNGALKLLDYVAAAKVVEIDDIYKNELKKNSKIVINKADVEKFGKNHKLVVDSMRAPLEKITMVENVKTRLKDVGGLKSAKEEISEDILEFVKNPKAYKLTGRRAPSGKLLTGPPGTGKTLLARAIAGEAGVPFIAMSGSDFGTSFINSGAMAVNEVFDRVEALARKTGKKVAILFIDEVDAIGRARSGGDTGGAEDGKAMNALLTRLDGLSSKDSDVTIITIGATNKPEILDKALTNRSSRLGQEILVDIPRLKADRLEVLNIHAKGKKFINEAEKVAMLEEMAETADGLNNDKLAQILDEAVGVAVKKPKDKFIERKDLFEGFLRAIRGRKREVDLSPEEFRRVQFHELGHAISGVVIDYAKLVHITNEPRGHALGTTYFAENHQMEDFFTHMKNIVCSYAGGLGETLYVKSHSTGVSGDFRSITQSIRTGILAGGLGIFTPQMSFVDSEGHEIPSLVAAYEKEITKDMAIYTATGEKIAERIKEFYKGFAYEFMDKCDKGTTKDGLGKNISGKEFMELMDNWLVKNNKKVKSVKLSEWAFREMELARTSNATGIKKYLRYLK